MTDKAPGQTAYAAYRQQMSRQWLVHWPGLSPHEQRAWEAAAQAVRALTKEEEPHE